MHVIYDAIHGLASSLRAMTFFQYSNAILGAGTVVLMIKFISQITKNRIAGIITGIFFGFTWGMLHYSSDANIYILILFLMLLVALLIGTVAKVAKYVDSVNLMKYNWVLRDLNCHAEKHNVLKA